jgi:hypothetical protein
VLDITVDRPWWLRPFKSGHLVLENAAQLQGLREIRYVPRPEDLAREIHRLRREGNARADASAPSDVGHRRHADHPPRRRTSARRRPH